MSDQYPPYQYPQQPQQDYYPPPDQQQGQSQQQTPSLQENQQRAQDQRQQQMDQQRKSEQERNAKAQNIAEEAKVDLSQIDDMIRAGYANVEQAGLDPANRPGNTIDAQGERPTHKSTKDLEDITGNPGHRGCTPYAPATSINRPTPANGDLESINEPVGVAQPDGNESWRQGGGSAQSFGREQDRQQRDDAARQNQDQSQQPMI